MIRYMAGRIVYFLPILFGITVIAFIVIHLAPGRPTDVMTELNPKMSLEAREKLAQIYGFDKPVVVQYGRWIRKLVSGDLGASFVDGRPVTKKIAEALPVTLVINIMSLVVIMCLAIPIGVRSALKRGSFFDTGMTVAVFILFSVPGFWLALMLMSFLGVTLGWLPVSGIVSLDFDQLTPVGKCIDILSHLVLPVVVGSLGGLAGISRYARERMIHVLHEDYIRTAYAKGVPERIIMYRHALRNALLPIITILGLSIPGLISGSVIFESVFNIPGMGRLMVNAVFTRDYNLIMGELVLAALLTLAGNLLADIAYAYADPRIRYGK
ncbi:MAG: ABC transporter permease [Candidatus Omnitrophica bacterium]|nr:ABC transporter permease [Candidatus Omnitrophota bacterium]